MSARSPVRPDPSAFFDPLPILSFDVVMADPPWLFALRSDAGATKAPQGQYCLPAHRRPSPPCRSATSRERDCWLWLWATFPMIHAARDVMDRVGLQPT